MATGGPLSSSQPPCPELRTTRQTRAKFFGSERKDAAPHYGLYGPYSVGTITVRLSCLRYADGRTMRLILSSVKVWPPIESTGGVCVMSTESTAPSTSLGTATAWPLASLPVIEIV